MVSALEAKFTCARSNQQDDGVWSNRIWRGRSKLEKRFDSPCSSLPSQPPQTPIGGSIVGSRLSGCLGCCGDLSIVLWYPSCHVVNLSYPNREAEDCQSHCWFRLSSSIIARIHVRTYVKERPSVALNPGWCVCVCGIIVHINPLQTKRRLLYLKTQSVLRSKHFLSRL